MLISDIEPIGEATTDLFVQDSNDLIDRIIELHEKHNKQIIFVVESNDRQKTVENILNGTIKNNNRA